MAIGNIFYDASSIMTVISFITFIGILWWVFGIKHSNDFDVAAHLPFADETDDSVPPNSEKNHG